MRFKSWGDPIKIQIRVSDLKKKKSWTSDSTCSGNNGQEPSGGSWHLCLPCPPLSWDQEKPAVLSHPSGNWHSKALHSSIFMWKLCNEINKHFRMWVWYFIYIKKIWLSLATLTKIMPVSQPLLWSKEVKCNIIRDISWVSKKRTQLSGFLELFPIEWTVSKLSLRRAKAFEHLAS